MSTFTFTDEQCEVLVQVLEDEQKYLGGITKDSKERKEIITELLRQLR